jgi:serine/threonine-protein kinase RsbW
METVSFPGRFESLPRVGAFISKAAKTAGLSDKAIYAVQLAVDEACSNIIDHAYGGEDRGEMLCSVIINDDGLIVILQDQGTPFNPQEIPDPQVNVPLEKLKPRGVGVYLMRKMVDEVHYEYSPEGGNMLTLIKRKTS